jgi:hypothetical protein
MSMDKENITLLKGNFDSKIFFWILINNLIKALYKKKNIYLIIRLE